MEIYSPNGYYFSFLGCEEALKPMQKPAKRLFKNLAPAFCADDFVRGSDFSHQCFPKVFSTRQNNLKWENISILSFRRSREAATEKSGGTDERFLAPVGLEMTTSG
jgi:hypothetical protein